MDTEKLTVRSLTKEEVTSVYHNHMVKDFPPSELKPLSTIIKSMEKGTHLSLGLFEEALEGPLSYAMFVKRGNDYLFDYLAVTDERRNQGIGSIFLKYIADYFKDAGSVIGEVEDPAYAKNQAEKELQDRRYRFYLRNGYVDTNVRVKLFGVDYIILQMDNGKKYTREEITELYKNAYKSFLPWFLYLMNVKVK